jgi:hypothetical protein
VRLRYKSLLIKYFFMYGYTLPSVRLPGRFPGGPGSANFFLPMLGRNGSSPRPSSPRSRPCGCCREIKKGFCDEKSLFIKLFSPIKRWFSFRHGGGAAQSDHGAGQTAEDQPHGRLGKRRSLYNDWNKY